MINVSMSPDLSADFQALVDHVTVKNAATQAAIVADGDVTQAKLAEITTVSGGISTEVQAVNSHVTSESERVLAGVASNSVIKSIQRGVVTLDSSINQVVVSQVDVNKSTLNFSYVNGHSFEGTLDSKSPMSISARGSLIDSTTIEFSKGRYMGEISAFPKAYWELIEYV